MDTYFSLFLNSSLASWQPEEFVALFLLGLARLLPMIAQSPFLGAKVLPHPVKIVFGISLWIIFLPTILLYTKGTITFNTMFIFLALKEIFIGMAMGLIMSIPFSIVQNIGLLIDHQRGGASLMVNDPTIQNQSSPIGTLLNMMLIFLFFVIDGPFYFFNAVVTSYEIIPVDSFLSSNFFTKNADFWKLEFDLLNKVMVMTAQLGAPALVIILMTDMFLGIANRLAPQVQITFLGMPLKSLLALLILTLGWKVFHAEVITMVMKWFDTLRTSIKSFGIT